MEVYDIVYCSFAEKLFQLVNFTKQNKKKSFTFFLQVCSKDTV